MWIIVQVFVRLQHTSFVNHTIKIRQVQISRSDYSRKVCLFFCHFEDELTLFPYSNTSRQRLLRANVVPHVWKRSGDAERLPAGWRRGASPALRQDGRSGWTLEVCSGWTFLSRSAIQGEPLMLPNTPTHTQMHWKNKKKKKSTGFCCWIYLQSEQFLLN